MCSRIVEFAVYEGAREEQTVQKKYKETNVISERKSKIINERENIETKEKTNIMNKKANKPNIMNGKDISGS